VALLRMAGRGAEILKAQKKKGPQLEKHATQDAEEGAFFFKKEVARGTDNHRLTIHDHEHAGTRNSVPGFRKKRDIIPQSRKEEATELLLLSQKEIRRREEGGFSLSWMA